MQKRIAIPQAGADELEQCPGVTITPDESQDPELMVSKPGAGEPSFLVVAGSDEDVPKALVRAIDVCGMSATKQGIQALKPGTLVPIDFLTWLDGDEDTNEMLLRFVTDASPRTPPDDEEQNN